MQNIFLPSQADRTGYVRGTGAWFHHQELMTFRRSLKPGQRVEIKGDSQAIWLSDYNVRVDSPATVLEHPDCPPSPRNQRVFVCIESIDGDSNVNAFVSKQGIFPIDDQPADAVS